MRQFSDAELQSALAVIAIFALIVIGLAGISARTSNMAACAQAGHEFIYGEGCIKPAPGNN